MTHPGPMPKQSVKQPSRLSEPTTVPHRTTRGHVVASTRSTLDQPTHTTVPLHRRERQDRADRTDEVLAHLDEARGDEQRRELTDELIELNMPVARSIAVRYRRRGIADED